MLRSPINSQRNSESEQPSAAQLGDPGRGGARNLAERLRRGKGREGPTIEERARSECERTIKKKPTRVAIGFLEVLVAHATGCYFLNFLPFSISACCSSGFSV